MSAKIASKLAANKRRRRKMSISNSFYFWVAVLMIFQDPNLSIADTVL
jgi:hypothetical protein